MTPTLTALDHLVLTVTDIEVSVQFYRDVLGMRAIRFATADGETRHALKFGAQKINLHLAGAEIEPRAKHAGPGTTDMCFLSIAPLDDWIVHLNSRHVAIEEGPVPRTGATGAINSIYIRDPDGNLIEISNQPR